MIDKNRSPPPGAFILDKYEQQIEDDVAQGLYVPVSDDDVAYFLKTWKWKNTLWVPANQSKKKTKPALA
jgi:hypothetical protein